MTIGLLARMFTVVSLIVFLSLQVVRHKNPPTANGRKILFLDQDTIKKDDFDQNFPLKAGITPESDIKNAYEFLNIPIWSNYFPRCEQNREYSCYELVRAYKTVKYFMQNIQSSERSSSILLNFNTSHSFSSLIGSVYAAFAICLSTNRKLYIQGLENTNFLNKKLLKTITPPIGIHVGRKVLSNHTFSCADFTNNEDTISFDDGMWVQSVYIHPTISPKLRKLFGMHAAHFLGNFLFGDFSDCPNSTDNVEIVAIMSQGDHNIKKQDLLKRANLCLPKENFSIIEFNSKSTVSERICKLKKAIGSRIFAYPLGDTAGWMVQAMKGIPGIAVQMKDNTCFKNTNSQAGSIDHLKNRKKNFAYSVNNHFHICGSNINDARIFINRILW